MSNSSNPLFLTAQIQHTQLELFSPNSPVNLFSNSLPPAEIFNQNIFDKPKLEISSKSSSTKYLNKRYENNVQTYKNNKQLLKSQLNSESSPLNVVLIQNKIFQSSGNQIYKFKECMDDIWERD